MLSVATICAYYQKKQENLTSHYKKKINEFRHGQNSTIFSYDAKNHISKYAL
jgi:hypothetical protein